MIWKRDTERFGSRWEVGLKEEILDWIYGLEKMGIFGRNGLENEDEFYFDEAKRYRERKLELDLIVITENWCEILKELNETEKWIRILWILK